MRRAQGVAARLADVAVQRQPAPTLWKDGLPGFARKSSAASGKVEPSSSSSTVTTWAWDVDELRERLRQGGQVNMKVDALVPRKPDENFVSQWKSAKTPMRADDALKRLYQGQEKLQLRLDPAVFWREHEVLPDLFYAGQNPDAFDALEETAAIDVAFDNSFVWVTSPGLRTSLHSDEDDGFLFHLAGRKRVVLVPPSSSDSDPRRLEALMRYRWRSGSHDELYNANMRPRVDRIHVELSPGDILYIPKRWLHDIEIAGEHREQILNSWDPMADDDAQGRGEGAEQAAGATAGAAAPATPPAATPAATPARRAGEGSAVGGRVDDAGGERGAEAQGGRRDEGLERGARRDQDEDAGEETDEFEAVTDVDRALEWEELAALVPNSVTGIDYENGPCISQSRLRLFNKPQSEVRVILWRDNHAWCPFSQKVWIWLEEKEIPYRVEKITLTCFGLKEDYYRELVPDGKVPAVTLDGAIITDSDNIIERLEASFGPLGEHSMRAPPVVRLRNVETSLRTAWLSWLTERDRSPADAKRRKMLFVQVLNLVERHLRDQSAGPFFLGAAISVVDVIFAPWLERINATAYYYKGFHLRYSASYPHISAWFDAMEARHTYRGTLSDFATHAHVVPPLFGVCHESGDDHQQECKRHVDEGPYLSIPDTGLDPPPNFARVALARVIKHKNSYMKQNPHRHGDTDEALRCALTFMMTQIPLRPPEGTASSLRYMRDRICVPRDMPCHSAEILRHSLEETARRDSLVKGTPIPVKHRLDQEPFAFIKAKQETFDL
ncbi:Glutathione S-transferase DHAR2 [Hondaea fermentalgiana]|uniref:Glutathione S-transferase DHAR2 n=1 Tax=Hondaea fermentalgiana TaxID=2315210 RepID=A0A2R5G0N6_9STRA|nr:Glutathione S-transferase DHAR2 [Hondaea fermentalgiana]|eukprot:GBG24085.1 Glutathione S-transferase DHAR2 [Hondaea fermentalgiana]